MNTTATHPFSALTPNPPALPTIRDEEWRFTPLKAVTGSAWQAPSPVKGSGTFFASRGVPELAALPGEKGARPRLVLVNGRIDESFSRLTALPAGLSIVRELPALNQADADQPFNALNAACAREGATLRVSRGVRIEKPVQVVYAGTDGAAFSRLRIELEPGAELALEEHFTGTGRHFLGSITEARIAENASLKLARVVADSPEAVHIGAFHARLNRDARLSLDSITLEAAFARTDLRVILDGEGANAALHGLSLAHDAALFDHQITVDHARPHCTSRQLFRNIVDDKARAVFAGRVIVRPGAMGTDANQTNNNLLLSDDARVDTKPQLEIYADDVKCSHGATSGQLDATAVFFLRSRGLDMQQARAVLTYAFANEIVEHVAVAGVGEFVTGAMRGRFHELKT